MKTKINNTFDLMCLLFDLQGAEKSQAFHIYQDGGDDAVVMYLISIGHPTLVKDEANQVKAMIGERQTVSRLLDDKSAASSAITLQRRLLLGKRTKEGD